MSNNWKIAIEGNGPHHVANPNDAVLLAEEFVEDLKAAGQTVIDATFTYDRVEQIIPLPSSSSSSSSAHSSSSSSALPPQT